MVQRVEEQSRRRCPAKLVELVIAEYFQLRSKQIENVFETQVTAISASLHKVMRGGQHERRAHEYVAS